MKQQEAATFSIDEHQLQLVKQLVVDESVVILNKFIKLSTEEEDYSPEEENEFLFNLVEIKKQIIPHCRTIHPLMDRLYQHLINYLKLITNNTTTTTNCDEHDNDSEEVKNLNQKLRLEIDEMLEITWTQLHTGHWSDVCQEWRSLHGLMCLLDSCIKLQCVLNSSCTMIPGWKIEDWMSVLRRCDEGLMMGDDAYREFLHKIADSVHDAIVKIFGIPSFSLLESKNNEESGDTKKKPKLSLPNTNNHDMRNRLKLDHDTLDHQIPVEDGNSISIMDFKKKYFDTQIPCLLKRASINWEAYRKWSNVNYLLEKAAYRAIPVEIGQYYTSDDWSQQIMPFHQYVRDYVLQPPGGAGGQQKIGYLAQHALFEQIHSLRKDIEEPIYCMLGEEGELSGINAWYGPCGTISPLHTDPCDNMLVQVVGHKFIRIYHPNNTPYLYKRQNGILQANTSEIDNLYILEGEEEEKKRLFEKFPLLSEANNFWDCVLSEGDMLFLPKQYWHYVQSLSISFSISFWFK